MKRLLVAIMAIVVMMDSTAMPTKEELSAAKSVVGELMEPLVAENKKGAKSFSEVADGAMELVQEAESDAEKFMLLRGAASYYARGKKYDKAADAVEEILALVPDIPPSELFAITSPLVKNAAQKTAPRLFSLNRRASSRVKADQQRKSVERKLKANPDDAALKRTYAELTAAAGDWTNALKAFAELGGGVGKVAAAELARVPDGEGAMERGKIADFWWNYKPTAEGCADAMREHAAVLYKAALDSGEITGLSKAVAEKRVAECFPQGGETALAAPAQSSKAATATHRAGAKKTIKLPGGEKMEFVWCPPGTFMMGSPTSEEGRDNDEAQHRVTLTKGFWLGKYEVTQKQWRSVMGSNPPTSRATADPWSRCRGMTARSSSRS